LELELERTEDDEDDNDVNDVLEVDRSRVFSDEDEFVRGAATGIITPDFLSPALENLGALSTGLVIGTSAPARGEGMGGRAPRRLVMDGVMVRARLLELDLRDSGGDEGGVADSKSL
jgi:hypothetical protein